MFNTVKLLIFFVLIFFENISGEAEKKKTIEEDISVESTFGLVAEEFQRLSSENNELKNEIEKLRRKIDEMSINAKPTEWNEVSKELLHCKENQTKMEKELNVLNVNISEMSVEIKTLNVKLEKVANENIQINMQLFVCNMEREKLESCERNNTKPEIQENDINLKHCENKNYQLNLKVEQLVITAKEYAQKLTNCEKAVVPLPIQVIKETKNIIIFIRQVTETIVSYYTNNEDNLSDWQKHNLKLLIKMETNILAFETRLTIWQNITTIEVESCNEVSHEVQQCRENQAIKEEKINNLNVEVNTLTVKLETCQNQLNNVSSNQGEPHCKQCENENYQLNLKVEQLIITVKKYAEKLANCEKIINPLPIDAIKEMKNIILFIRQVTEIILNFYTKHVEELSDWQKDHSKLLFQLETYILAVETRLAIWQNATTTEAPGNVTICKEVLNELQFCNENQTIKDLEINVLNTKVSQLSVDIKTLNVKLEKVIYENMKENLQILTCSNQLDEVLNETKKVILFIRQLYERIIKYYTKQKAKLNDCQRGHLQLLLHMETNILSFENRLTLWQSNTTTIQSFFDDEIETKIAAMFLLLNIKTKLLKAKKFQVDIERNIVMKNRLVNTYQYELNIYANILKELEAVRSQQKNKKNIAKDELNVKVLRLLLNTHSKYLANVIIKLKEKLQKEGLIYNSSIFDDSLTIPI